MPPDQKTTVHLAFLDVLRGVAILWVFLSHGLGVSYGDRLPQWGSGWLRDFAKSDLPVVLFPLINGYAGVAIFFVISGFCIHLSYLRGRPGDWRGFFARRFFRIYPPYLAALLLFAFCFPKTRLAFSPSFDWGQLLSHVLLLHNARSDWFFGINGSFWTIAVEAQLYLLYPLLLALVGKWGWRPTLWSLGIVEGLLRAYECYSEVATGHGAPLWFIGLPFYFWFSWTLGAALADAHVRNAPLPVASWPLWPWVVLAVGTPAVKCVAAYTFPCIAIGTSIIVARLLRGDGFPLSRMPGAVTAHLRRLGVWSYACYLLHQPVLNLLAYAHLKISIPPALDHPPGYFAACLGLYPLVVGMSALFRQYVEMPSIAWGKWFLQRGGRTPRSGLVTR